MKIRRLAIACFLLISMFPEVGESSVMVASWYGQQHAGKKTASGERFDPHKYTCAHKTLPLGSYLQVTNLETGKYVVVKVNDRGPYIPGRHIDLSFAAAKKIGMLKKGVSHVEVTRIGYTPPPTPTPHPPIVEATPVPKEL